MTISPTTNRSLVHIVWGILITSVLLPLPALAQDPVVDSADPPSAEQETYDLEVEIIGDNFGKDSEVDFFVTGTTNPGGITVKGKPKVLGPKKLKVRIDVDAAATVDDFDIQVMSRGRTGKGIELFRVLEKTHPNQDTTPPGVPTNFQVLDVTYGSVLVSFTMPADDGYDPASGPASHCPILVTPSDGPNSHWINDSPWGQPGEEELVVLSSLAPETTYLFSLQCWDDVGGNASAAVEFTETTYPFSAFQDFSWAITEIPVHLDSLIGHRYDAAGNVVIAGTVGTWGRKKGWQQVLLSSTIRLVTGTWDGDTGSWIWSIEDVPGFANRFASHPGGRPAFAGQELIDTKPRYEYELTYTFHDGTAWITETVTSFETETYNAGAMGFAIDPSGEPGIAWCSGANAPGVRLARRDGTGQWSIDTVNTASCEDRGDSTVLSFDDVGNPGILWIDREDSSELRLSYGSPQGWSEELVDALSPGDIWGIDPVALAFDPSRGDFTAVWDTGVEVSVCDRAGTSGWGCTEPIPFGSGTNSHLALDSAGEQLFGLVTESGQDVALARRLHGQPSWTIEHVDHYTTHGLPFPPDQAGPFVALDVLDRPTLSWVWGNIGGDEGPSEDVHFYFAWKP